MDLTSLLSQFPVWSILILTGALFLGVGLLLSNRIWGKNEARLKAALDESSYLASQWATLGISQSQLVEKLGKKACEKSTGEDGHLLDAIRDRDNKITILEKKIFEIEQEKSAQAKREVEALQLQVLENQKKDTRIQTLENRLHHIDAQHEQNLLEHKEQVQVLLDRIAGLEETGGGKPDAVIQENNRQLTELLKQRCKELEMLRDEFHNKERALKKIREQNAVLKQGVDDLVNGWSKKKGEIEEVGELKARLAETTEELTKVKRDFEMREVEIDMLQSDSDLVAVKSANEEVKEELTRSSAQVDMLLDVIESRDRRVEELESLIHAGDKNGQIEALSKTIEGLQSKFQLTEEKLEATRAETSTLKSMISQKQDEVEARDLQLSVLKAKLGDELNFDDLFKAGSPELDGANRLLAEAKEIGGARQGSSHSGVRAVYFGENSAFIKNEGNEIIREIAREIRNSGCQVSVTGYAESEGNSDFNVTLSMRRAEAVREKLKQEGVDADLLTVKGKGEDTTLSGTGDSWKARRAEIVILPVTEPVN
ncbi:MAG: OmpA family protein [Verrucomicrobiales bacterium]|nr:OmpA family protein [Verrucomicrobiales bacterium]